MDDEDVDEVIHANSALQRMRSMAVLAFRKIYTTWDRFLPQNAVAELVSMDVCLPQIEVQHRLVSLRQRPLKRNAKASLVKSPPELHRFAFA